MEYILRTHHLSKCFNQLEVIKNVDIHIKKGEIYGFLGPNGAGKSTVMKMIMNLIQPTSGTIEVFGKDIKDEPIEMLKRMGAIIENPIFYEKLTARENLELHCEYMGYPNLKDIDEALKLVNLRGIDKKAIGHFSLGMKQRLAIARTIITRPELIILDEPINGLDPEGISEIRNLLKLLSKEYGMTIMVSSHILSEIEQMADTIGVINEGKLIEEVAMDSINKLNDQYIEACVSDVKKSLFILETQLGFTNVKILDDRIIRIYENKASINGISKVLITNDVAIESISQKKDSLEEHFLKLTKGEGIHV